MMNVEAIEDDILAFNTIDINQIQAEHLNIIRNFRNFCAKSPNLTHVFIDHSVVLETFQKFRSYAFQKIESKIDSLNKASFGVSTASDDLQNTQFLFIKLATQFISNFATCSPQNCAYLWSTDIGESRFQDAIAAASMMKNRQALGAIIHTIHQCINVKKIIDSSCIAIEISNCVKTVEWINGKNDKISNPNPHTTANRMITFLRWRALNCQILLSVASVKIETSFSPSSSSSSANATSVDAATIVPCGNNNSNNGDGISDPALEWLHLLIHRIMCSTNTVPAAMVSMDPLGDSNDAYNDKCIGSNDMANNGYDYDLYHHCLNQDPVLRLFHLVGPSSSSSEYSVSDSLHLQQQRSNNTESNNNNNNSRKYIKNLSVKHLTHEQLILLHAVLAVLEDSVCAKELAVMDDDDYDGISLLTPCGGLLVELADLISQQITYALRRVKLRLSDSKTKSMKDNDNDVDDDDISMDPIAAANNKNDDDDDDDDDDKHSATADDMSTLIEIISLMTFICSTRLASLTADKTHTNSGNNSSSSSSSNRRSLSLRHHICTAVAHLIPSLVSYLGYLNQVKSNEFELRSTGNSNASGDNNNSSNTWQDNVVDEDNKLQSLSNACLQLLGNLMYRCSLAQNQLRECGGLLQLLGVCNTDVSHPLRREWALLCLRNACEGSILNQESIGSLTLQGVKEVDTRLNAAGLGVDFDPNTGKINFKKNCE